LEFPGSVSTKVSLFGLGPCRPFSPRREAGGRQEGGLEGGWRAAAGGRHEGREQ